MTSRRARWPSAFVLIALVAMLPSGLYLAWAAGAGPLGFPLDDAWIHQTYARNLAQSGSLAFVPGEPSAGSTSPLWSGLLALGYLLGVEPRVWTYGLGILCLALIGWLAASLARRFFPAQPGVAVATGVFCLLEWHLVWAAVSGMETLLFTGLTLWLVDRALAQHERPTPSTAVLLGAAGGLATLARPEGIALTGLVMLAILVAPGEEASRRLPLAALAVAAAAILLAPYLLFNLRTSGSLFPNTLYAKQAEYQVTLSVPARLLRMTWPPWIGGQVLLVPGFLVAILRFLRHRSWLRLVPAVWWAGLAGAYALRLPVTYQHGRYLMPVIPWLVIYGIGGTWSLLQPRSSRRAIRLASRTLPLAATVLALVFLTLGARAYRNDVGFIEGEMVAAARWLATHTAPGTLIAAHDIGAIGYFAQRPILDLAGLVTPQVIPFMSDPERLLAFMQTQHAQYAVFFPDFSPTYRQLAEDQHLTQVYDTGYAWTREQGLLNMAVYRIQGQDTTKLELHILFVLWYTGMCAV